MNRIFVAPALALSLSLTLATPSVAASPVHFGEIWLDGALVRTLLPPAARAQEGIAPF